MLDVLYRYETFSGVWPEKNRIKDIIKLIINIGLMFYLITGMLLYLIAMLREPAATVMNITDAMYTVQTSGNFCFNYIGCVVLRKSSLKFFRNVRNFDLFGVPKNLHERDAQINKNVALIVGYCVTGCIGGNAYYVFTKNWCIKRHNVGDIHFCGYPCGLYYHYDYDHGVLAIIHKILITYTYTLLCATGILFICAGYCAIEYMVIKLEHLKEMLAEVQTLKERPMILQLLNTCVKYHIHIISLAEELNSCYSVINSPAMFFYSVTLGICFYSLSNEYTIKALLLTIGYIMAIFLLAMSGQNLMDASESIAFAVYDMEWYNMDVDTRKYISFIMLRGQRPLTFKGGPFGVFSLPVFMNVIRGSYSYMTMQSNMK